MGNPGVAKEMYSELRRALPPQLPAYLTAQRWFGGKARRIDSTEIAGIVPLDQAGVEALILVVRVSYTDGAQEEYAVPLRVAAAPPSSNATDLTLRIAPQRGGTLILTDALQDEGFLSVLLGAIRHETSFGGEWGELHATRTTAFADLSYSSKSLQPRVVGSEQSNSSIIYGNRLILKFFRRIEKGINPDLELAAFLTEKAHFPNTPQLAGSLEYRSKGGGRMAQGILQQFVPNQGDAWRYTLNSVIHFYDLVLANSEAVAAWQGRAGRHYFRELSSAGRNLVDPYLESVGLLGKRTAELHLALASDQTDPAFAPEPFTEQLQRDLERALLDLTSRVLGLLRDKISQLPAHHRDQAGHLLAREGEIVRAFQSALKRPIRAARIRIHGDYHLGQVLFTGSDFVIIDFEGEPARPLADRRTKRSPLQDVAGMLRSFHYAALAPLFKSSGNGLTAQGDRARLSPWAELWNATVSRRFLKSYLASSGTPQHLPADQDEIKNLLELHLLEKAIYELGYELNNRPTWVGIPLEGILQLLSPQQDLLGTISDTHLD